MFARLSLSEHGSLNTLLRIMGIWIQDGEIWISSVSASVIGARTGTFSAVVGSCRGRGRRRTYWFPPAAPRVCVRFLSLTLRSLCLLLDFFFCIDLPDWAPWTIWLVWLWATVWSLLSGLFLKSYTVWLTVIHTSCITVCDQSLHGGFGGRSRSTTCC